MYTGHMLAPSPGLEPPPRRPGRNPWDDLWPMFVAFVLTVLAGLGVIAIVLGLTAK